LGVQKHLSVIIEIGLGGAIVTDKELTYDEVIEQVERFPPTERMRLVEQIISNLRRDLEAPTPLKSFYGILADLGPGVSVEDLDEIRREMWSNFPREDIGE
jgi:hypothetical protein